MKVFNQVTIHETKINERVKKLIDEYNPKHAKASIRKCMHHMNK